MYPECSLSGSVKSDHLSHSAPGRQLGGTGGCASVVNECGPGMVAPGLSVWLREDPNDYMEDTEVTY